MSVCVHCRALATHSSGWPSANLRVLAADVRALLRVAVGSRMVPAPVGDPGHRLDPEVVVPDGDVPGNRGRGTVDVDAVVPGTQHDVALNERVLDRSGAFLVDHDAVLRHAAYDVLADDGVGCQPGERVDADSPPGTRNVIPLERVPGPTLERDAEAATGAARYAGDVVAADDVVVTGQDEAVGPAD